MLHPWRALGLSLQLPPRTRSHCRRARSLQNSSHQLPASVPKAQVRGPFRLATALVVYGPSSAPLQRFTANLIHTGLCGRVPSPAGAFVTSTSPAALWRAGA